MAIGTFLIPVFTIFNCAYNKLSRRRENNHYHHELDNSTEEVKRDVNNFQSVFPGHYIGSTLGDFQYNVKFVREKMEAYIDKLKGLTDEKDINELMKNGTAMRFFNKILANERCNNLPALINPSIGRFFRDETTLEQAITIIRENTANNSALAYQPPNP